ncbi:MAG TPA: hypothetical protein VG755_27600 [Nannocystaceae bacterium]|nr:hypothetical protein [Nannocystaceae bacterium]
MTVLLGGAACRPKPVDAPYAKGEAPTADELLARAAPQLPAIQVPQAKVIANRALRGNLAFLAQAPSRFRGTVGIAGNELVTLAFSEDGYALRYKLDAFPTGFYHGPPASCAVEALIGVAIDESDLVALVLGGAPVIEGPHTILQQRWDGVARHESLELANATHVQALYFRPIEGEWRFVGGQLWQRDANGGKGKRLWQLEHEGLAKTGDYVLPERTKITAPGKRRDNLVVIQYRDRELDPAFAKQSGGEGGASDGGKTDGGDDGTPTDEGGSEWGGDDGWEGEPGENAEADPPAKPPEPEAPPANADAQPSVDAQPVPKVFHVDATGLSDRGDLCR